MPSSQPFARDDTMLGVCQSLGEDFGFNPNYLRVLFGASLIWNPIAVIGVYAALAVVVALSHLVFPNRLRTAEMASEPEAAAEGAPGREPANQDMEALAKAA